MALPALHSRGFIGNKDKETTVKLLLRPARMWHRARKCPLCLSPFWVGDCSSTEVEEHKRTPQLLLQTWVASGRMTTAGAFCLEMTPAEVFPLCSHRCGAVVPAAPHLAVQAGGSVWGTSSTIPCPTRGTAGEICTFVYHQAQRCLGHCRAETKPRT